MSLRTIYPAHTRVVYTTMHTRTVVVLPQINLKHCPASSILSYFAISLDHHTTCQPSRSPAIHAFKGSPTPIPPLPNNTCYTARHMKLIRTKRKKNNAVDVATGGGEAVPTGVNSVGCQGVLLALIAPKIISRK